jgi:hypothetical protein
MGIINKLNKRAMEKKRKSVLVTFENYYCRIEKVLVIGTVNCKKAIKVVKESQIGRKCEIKNAEVGLNLIGYSYEIQL